MPRNRYTQEEFDSLLAVKNPKVVRVGKYVTTKTKIEFKCLNHNEIHWSTPSNILSGKGLNCCQANKTSLEKAALRFDNRVAKINPLIKRLDDYQGSNKKIRFKCLKHNEIHLSRPRCILHKGSGLSCCSASKLKIEIAASKFDLKLYKINPLIKRLDEYVGTDKKIKFKCLKHNEVHKTKPKYCLLGCGLKCCSMRLGSSLKNILKINDNCQTTFYTYSLSLYKKYVKFGIARSIKLRKDSEYGEEIFSKKFSTRLEAFAVEQACLRDSQLVKDCPEELHLNKWRGRTEVRKCSRQTALARANFYVQELDSIGVKEFILKYLNPSPYEKALLKRKSL